MNKRNTKHGMYDTRIYACYNDMKQRCLNPNCKSYKNYGGRGIKVCDEWLDKENGFMNFYNWAMANGYQDNLTIDRIDVNGNYESFNCRWITIQNQAFNRRSNILLTFENKTQTLTEWAREKNIDPRTLYNRICIENWNIDRALTTPTNKKFSYIIQQYDESKKLIREWNSSREIERELGFHHNTIVNMCKNEKMYQNFYWKIKGITSLEVR